MQLCDALAIWVLEALQLHVVNIKHCSIYNIYPWVFCNTRVVSGLFPLRSDLQANQTQGLSLAKALKYCTVSMATSASLVSGGLRLFFLAIKSWTAVHKSLAGLVVSSYLKGLMLCFTAVARLTLDQHWKKNPLHFVLSLRFFLIRLFSKDSLNCSKMNKLWNNF